MNRYLYVANTARGAPFDGFLTNVEKGWKSKKDGEPAYIQRYFGEGLADVGDDDKLYIVGHGSLAGTSVNQITASDLFTHLKQEQLPATHRNFYLFSCYSGVVMPGANKCFAEAFAFEIRNHFRSARVHGYAGAVNFDRDLGIKQVAKSLTIINGSQDFDTFEHAKNNKISFSVDTISRWCCRTQQTVVADQARSYNATVNQDEEEEDGPFGRGTLKSTRVVVY